MQEMLWQAEASQYRIVGEWNATMVSKRRSVENPVQMTSERGVNRKGQAKRISCCFWLDRSGVNCWMLSVACGVRVGSVLGECGELSNACRVCVWGARYCGRLMLSNTRYEPRCSNHM